ncbi:LysR family transcriptional regulator [Streptomyces sp. NPDC012421]|uniref:LysR family transcriptional regulator n=1 Tax=Streptomyces sp. NPDC012421 TaxID=3364832 RepID=UPI0036E728C2
MQLELRHLEAVCRIAEAGSLGRAAQLLGVSQPALSAQLRRIERVAGGELFLRGRRGVEPTPLGEFVLSKARLVLGEMDALAAGARAADPDTPLRLGCILLVLVDTLLGRLDQVVAGREIAVTVEHSATTLTRQLGAGRYDAVLYGEVNDHEVPLPQGTTARTVVPKEPFCVRLSAEHPLAGKERIPLAELAGESWMTLVEDDDGGPEALAAACERAGFTPSLRHRVSDRKIHYDLIASGRAISLSQPTAPPTEGTVLRPLEGDPVTGRIRLAWNRSTVSARHADLLHRAAVEAYLANVPNNPFHQEWWSARPELHPVLADRGDARS